MKASSSSLYLPIHDHPIIIYTNSRTGLYNQPIVVFMMTKVGPLSSQCWWNDSYIHLLMFYRNRADDHFKIRYLQIPPFVNLWNRYWLQCALYYYYNTTLFSISPHEYPVCFFFVLISLIYLFFLPFFILFYPASNLLFIHSKNSLFFPLFWKSHSKSNSLSLLCIIPI